MYGTRSGHLFKWDEKYDESLHPSLLPVFISIPPTKHASQSCYDALKAVFSHFSAYPSIAQGKQDLSVI